MKSKTLILQSQTDNQSGRAILTLSKQDDMLTTKLRLYNFAPLSPQSKIGVYHNNQVYSGNMLLKDGAYISSLVGDFDMDNDFYCAVIDTENNNAPLLAGGTYAGFYFNDTSVITNNLNNSFSPNKITPARETACESVKPAHASKPPHCNCPNEEEYSPCKSCKYKDYFFAQNPELPSQQPKQTYAQKTDNTATQEDKPTKAQIPTILESLIPQFDYIFKTFPECVELNSRIENSKFVTISEGSSTYCLGAIYKDNQPEYICYAVPTAYNAPVPEELGSHHQWLPLDPDDPLSDGYHIVYQDAHDLKIVEF